MELSDELRIAAVWVEHQEDPAPDWDALLIKAANEIDRLNQVIDRQQPPPGGANHG